jgi:hypothetical protein
MQLFAQAEVAALSEKVADVKRGVQRASRELGAPFAVLEQRTGQLRRVAQVHKCEHECACEDGAVFGDWLACIFFSARAILSFLYE